MAPDETNTMKPAQRAIKKIRTVALVSSLTRGWQQWAADHSTKQSHEPSGWVPNTEGEVTENHKSTLNVQLKPAVAEPRKDGDPPSEETEETHIKTKSVTKSFSSKAQEKGMDIGSLAERYEKDPGAQKYDDFMVDKLLQGNGSPTRRRKCSNLVSQLTKSWKQIEHHDEGTETSTKTLPTLAGCRSESLETNDSGYGESEEVKPEKEKVEIPEEKEDTARIKRSYNSLESLETDNSGYGESEEVKPEKEKEEIPEEKEDTARIKRSYNSLNNKAVSELNNINKAYKRHSQVNNIKGRWEKWSGDHTVNQKLNPFSDEFDHDYAMSQRLQKGDEGYGRPKEGTKTAERAMRAEAHIHREMRDLCFIISTLADPGRDGKVRVTFGELFDRYVRISDKVVGILLRARKHGMVDFPGEMLWQGRDDNVIITLM